MSDAEEKQHGNRRHPNKETADSISVLAAGGMSREGIAFTLKISSATIYEYYKDNLELGDQVAASTVITKIFNAVQKGEEWALKWWSARRMGWQETQRTELTGANGKPVAITKLEADDDEDTITRRLASLAAAANTDGIPGESDEEAEG